MVRSGTNFNEDSPMAPFVLLSRVSAAIVVVISLRLSMLLYGVKVSDPYIVLMIISILLSLILFRGPTTGMFMSQRFWSISLSIVSRWLLFFAILLLIGYATKVSATFSRLTLFTWLIATPALLVLAQVGVEYLAMRYVLATHRAKRIVIAGANELGRTLAEKIETSPYIGANIEGFFDDRSSDRLGNDASVNVIGKLTELADYVRTHNIELIFVVLPLRNIQRVSELLDELHDTTASIYFVPDIFVFDLIQCRTGDIDSDCNW